MRLDELAIQTGAVAVAAALDEAKLARKRKILNTVLIVVVIAVVIVAATMVYKLWKR